VHENRLPEPIKKQALVKDAALSVKLQLTIVRIAVEPHEEDEMSRKLFAKLHDRIKIGVPRVYTDAFFSELL
jgi:hypothetical protein